MKIKFIHNANQDRKQSTPGTSKETVISQRKEINITDGGEFFDDNKRMKEQPFGVPTQADDRGEENLVTSF